MMSFELYDSEANSDTVIEDFLVKFLEEQDNRTKAVSLYSFIKSYLQSAEKDNLETRRKASFKIILKVPELFAVLTQFNNPTSYNDEKEIKALNLQGAVLCLDTLLMYQECFKKNEYLQSLLQVTLEVLYQAYSHCKDSENLYSDLLEDFTDQLAGFYQKIQDTQTVMIMGFDHLLTLDLYAMDNSTVISMVDNLGKLCKLVSSLDAMIAVKLWRIYIKIISHFSSIIHEKLEVASILSSLIISITNIVYECKFKLNNNEKIEESDIKIFLFQINLIMKIFHVFHGCPNDNFQDLGSLVLELYSLLILSYSSLEGEDDNQQILKNALMSTFLPMMSLFHSNNSFLASALEIDVSENSSDFQLPYLLLKLTAVMHLNADNGSNYTHSEQRVKVLKNIFKFLQKNNPEDNLKFVFLKFPQALFRRLGNAEGNNKQATTLYAEFYLSLSEHCKLISDSDFQNLAVDMAECLTSSSDIISLLISDVWMYRLRCTSVEYLYTSSIHLSSMILRTDSSFYQKLHLKRMLKFLPSDKKLKLFEESKTLLSYIQRPIHRYGIPSYTVNQVSDNFKEINLLMAELEKPVSREEQNVVKKACTILELLSLIINSSTNSEILKYMELASFLFKTEIYEVQIGVLTFLKEIGRKHLTKESSNFQTTVNFLAVLLTEVLRSKNYLIRQEAFATYSNFAQTTHHPEILQASAALAPNLIPVIKSYIIKEPLLSLLTEKERLKSLLEQLHVSTTHQNPEKMLSEKCKKITSCLEQLFL